jgi:serine/threonine protein kinase
VGWSRRYAHLLINQQQPWDGISEMDAGVAAVLEDQQQAQQQQQQGQGPGQYVADMLIPQADYCALKVATRYTETSSSHQARLSCEEHYQLHWLTLQNEHAIACSVFSENMIKSYGAGFVSSSAEEQLPCMLLEWAPGGSLSQWIENSQEPTEGRVKLGMDPAMAREYMRGIARGVSALHAQSRTFHRDLKCSNILLGGGGGVGELLVPKVSDFGTCWWIDDPAACEYAMTECFRAPEQQPGMFQDQKLDTFHMVLVFLNIRFGVLPFSYHGETPSTLHLPPLQPEQYRDELVRPDSPYNQDDPSIGREKLTAEEVEFLQLCLAPNVAQRPHVGWLVRNSSYLQGPAPSEVM